MHTCLLQVRLASVAENSFNAVERIDEIAHIDQEDRGRHPRLQARQLAFQRQGAFINVCKIITTSPAPGLTTGLPAARFVYECIQSNSL